MHICSFVTELDTVKLKKETAWGSVDSGEWHPRIVLQPHPKNSNKTDDGA